MALKEQILDRAQKYVLKGNVDKALAEYKAAFDLDPRDLSVRLKIGDLYVKSGRKTEAIKEYTEVAKANAQRGFYLKAIAVYKQALKLENSNIETHYKLADLYVKQRLIADAISEYSFILSVFEKKGKTNEVLEIVKKMVEVDSENIGVRLKLADLYQKMSFDKDALEEYSFIFEKLLSQGKFDTAEKIYIGLYNNNPRELTVIKGLSDLYKKKGDGREHLRFSKALFNIYRDKDDTEEARAICSSILDIKPEDPDALGFMARFRPVEEVQMRPPSPPEPVPQPTPPASTPQPFKFEEPEPVIEAPLKAETPVQEIEAPISVEEAEEPLISWPVDVEITLEGFEEEEGRAGEGLRADSEGAGPARAGIGEAGEGEGLDIRDAFFKTLSAEPDEPVAGVPVGAEVEIELPVELPLAPEVREPEIEIASREEQAVEKTEVPALEMEEEQAKVTFEAEAPVEVAAGAFEPEKVIEEAIEPARPVFEAEAPVEVAAGAFEPEKVIEEAIEPARPIFEAEAPVDVAAGAFEPEKVIEEAVEPARPVFEAEAPVDVAAAALELEKVVEAAIETAFEQTFDEYVEAVPTEAPAVVEEAVSGRKLAGEVLPAEAVLKEEEFAGEEITEEEMESEQISSAIEDINRGLEAVVEREAEIAQEAALEEAGGVESEIRLEPPSTEGLSGFVSEPMGNTGPEYTLIESGMEDKPRIEEPQAQERKEEYVDLSAELGMEEALHELSGTWGEGEPEETVAEFKKGMGEQLGKEDIETHYNLGIAYMEMGLFNEASMEFKIALKDQRLEFDCYARLGLCAMNHSNPDEAIVYYLKGLKVKGRSDEERKGIMYELALAYEAAGKKEESLHLFKSIYSMDGAYREVAGKIKVSIPRAPFIPLDDGLIEVEFL